MALAQKLDAGILLLLSKNTNLILKDVPFGPSNTTILCDVSTGKLRPLVPENCKRQIFDTFHSLSHPGARATQKLIVDKFVWQGVKRQIRTWTRMCSKCQMSKINTHVKAPLARFEEPRNRFSHIHIDIVEPLPCSRGYTHLLTIIDRYTRWPEAVPLSDISTQSCARALILNWIARFGLPAEITYDRGTQFTSELWSLVARFLGIQLHHTTASHSQSNGLVERFHRHLKESLRARLTESNWIDELPWTLLGIRTVPRDDLKSSAAKLVYGFPLVVPGEFSRKV